MKPTLPPPIAPAWFCQGLQSKVCPGLLWCIGKVSPGFSYVNWVREYVRFGLP